MALAALLTAGSILAYKILLAGRVPGRVDHRAMQILLVGWTAGGGFEWQFKENWSVKGEYLYYDLGNASASVTNYAYPNSGGSFVRSQSNYSARFNGNILRAGVIITLIGVSQLQLLRVTNNFWGGFKI